MCSSDLPFASIGRGVALNRMYSETRRRETIYGQFLFRYHPDFCDTRLYYDRRTHFHIEGGDVLNLNAKTIAVGISQRTEPAAIEQLALNLLAPASEVETVYAILLPESRAFMHLDTVFTQVDVDKFTVHAGIMENLKVFRLIRADGSLQIREDSRPLQQILAEAMGTEGVELLECGGGEYITADREQWNDGSNTLAIAPGKVIVYERNDVTNQLLVNNGIEVLTMPSGELCRGRGGPRCMSMPLWRED